MKTEKKQWIPMLIVFLVAFIPRMILALVYGGAFAVPVDEMSTIATAAMTAGYDWSDATIYAASYYGGGYTILFTPFFKLGLDAYLIYDIMLLVSCAIQSVAAPICYYILKKYFEISSRGVLFWVSVAASYLVVLRVMKVYNEHMLIGVSWCIALTICKLIEYNKDYKKKSIYTIMLVLEMSYLMTCHTRAKTYWYALVVLVFLFYFLYKKWLVAVGPAVIFGGIGYFLSGKFIDHIKTMVWHWEEGEKLKNTSVNLDISLDTFTEISTYRAILSTILGQINATFVFSTGIFCILIVLICCIWYKKLKNVVLERYCHKEKEEENTEISGEKVILMLSVFFGMCMVATTLAQSLTWLDRVVKAYDGGDTYGYKAFSYVRYNAIYYGPFFVAGFGYLYQIKEKIKNYLKGAMVLFAVIFLGWLILVLPYISGEITASGAYVPFGYLWYIFSENPYDGGLYLTAMLSVCICFGVFLALLWKKRVKLCIAIFSALLIYQYVVGVVDVDAKNVAKYEDKINATCQFLKQAKESDKLPDDIYVVLDKKGVRRQVYIYQFLFYEYRFLRKTPSKEITEAVVLSDLKDIEQLLEEGYLCCQLDVNEYLYVKGDSLINVFEGMGWNFNSGEK